MSVGDLVALPLGTLNSGEDRAIGASPPHDQKVALRGANDLQLGDVVGDVGNLFRAGADHVFVVGRVVTDVPRHVFLFDAADAVFQSIDVDTVYRLPIALSEQGLDQRLASILNIWSRASRLSAWEEVVKRITEPKRKVQVGFVGKYVQLVEAYKSLNEALLHGGIANDCRVEIKHIDSEDLEKVGTSSLAEFDGILVAPGFGARGTEGKIAAVRYAREKQVPYFGICFGMQMAVIEAARNLLGLKGASSSEFGPCDVPVVGLMTEWLRGNALEKRQAGGDMGGTMRLGAYDCHLQRGSKVHEIYGQDMISERHRHRYEVNVNYKGRLEQVGLRFSGMSPDGVLPEIVEIVEHPWFVGVQFHPELKSKPFDPHPLFTSFVGAALEQSRLV